MRKKRFNELSRLINGISPTALTKSLRHLENEGMINRTVIPTVPVTVEYSVTEKGESFHKIIKEMKKNGAKSGPRSKGQTRRGKRAWSGFCFSSIYFHIGLIEHLDRLFFPYLETGFNLIYYSFTIWYKKQPMIFLYHRDKHSPNGVGYVVRKASCTAETSISLCPIAIYLEPVRELSRYATNFFIDSYKAK